MTDPSDIHIPFNRLLGETGRYLLVFLILGALFTTSLGKPNPDYNDQLYHISAKSENQPLDHHFGIAPGATEVRGVQRQRQVATAS